LIDIPRLGIQWQHQAEQYYPAQGILHDFHSGQYRQSTKKLNKMSGFIATQKNSPKTDFPSKIRGSAQQKERHEHTQ
jgi:hypothetical protein